MKYIVLRCPDPKCRLVHAIPEDDTQTFLYASLQVIVCGIPSLEAEYNNPEDAKEAYLFFERNPQGFKKD